MVSPFGKLGKRGIGVSGMRLRRARRNKVQAIPFSGVRRNESPEVSDRLRASRQLRPVRVCTVTGISGAGPSSGKAARRIVFRAAAGGGEVRRGRGRERMFFDGERARKSDAGREALGAREVVARPARPSRCTLPMTALRVASPICCAMTEALSPSFQILGGCY